MKFLLDTHLLLWAAAMPERLSPAAREIFDDAASEIVFSVGSIWEVAIKNGLGRADFRVDPRLLRQEFLGAGYQELTITGLHAAGIDALPPIHKDPFDRLLVAQATVEDIVLVTADAIVGRYPGPIRLV